MRSHLEEIHDVLLIVIEAAQLPQTWSSHEDAWAKLTSSKDGLGHTDNDDEGQFRYSPAITHVERLIKALRMTVTKEIVSEEAWTLARLEAMLEDAPGLVHRRNEQLTNEGDFQRIMHDYLSACFPDFRRDPQIGGGVKNFKPDCGIASVGAEIEFKLAHTREQAVVSFTGVVEDTGGY